MASLIPDYKNPALIYKLNLCLCNYDCLNSSSFVLFVLIESVDHLFFCPWLHGEPPQAERLLWWDVFPSHISFSVQRMLLIQYQMFLAIQDRVSLYIYTAGRQDMSLCVRFQLLNECLREMEEFSNSVVQGSDQRHWLPAQIFNPHPGTNPVVCVFVCCFGVKYFDCSKDRTETMFSIQQTP